MADSTTLIGWGLVSFATVALVGVVTNRKPTDVLAHALTGAQESSIDTGSAVSTAANNGGYASDSNAVGVPLSAADQSQKPAAAQGGSASAVAYAEQQLGKPYLWGATGPDRFDCSGLTMKAYAAAGYSLPHNSYAQWVKTKGSAIPTSGAIPAGALVFFGTGGSTAAIHHVGIATGGDVMVNAPQTGEVVSYHSISAEPGFCAATMPL